MYMYRKCVVYKVGKQFASDVGQWGYGLQMDAHTCPRVGMQEGRLVITSAAGNMVILLVVIVVVAKMVEVARISMVIMVW